MLRRILKRRGVDTRPAQPGKAIFPDTLTKHFECLANFAAQSLAFSGVGASRSTFAFSRRRGSVLLFFADGHETPPTTANSRGGAGQARRQWCDSDVEFATLGPAPNRTLPHPYP